MNKTPRIERAVLFVMDDFLPGFKPFFWMIVAIWLILTFLEYLA